MRRSCVVFKIVTRECFQELWEKKLVKEIKVPKHLRAYCSRKLPRKKVNSTNNLLRRFFYLNSEAAYKTIKAWNFDRKNNSKHRKFSLKNQLTLSDLFSQVSNILAWIFEAC